MRNARAGPGNLLKPEQGPGFSKRSRWCCSCCSVRTTTPDTTGQVQLCLDVKRGFWRPGSSQSLSPRSMNDTMTHSAPWARNLGKSTIPSPLTFDHLPNSLRIHPTPVPLSYPQCSQHFSHLFDSKGHLTGIPDSPRSPYPYSPVWSYSQGNRCSST